MATKTTERTFTTHIDIPVEKRAALIETLNQHLATTLDLYTQVKQAHWNVKGKDFYQLHLLFDEIAEEIEPFIDLSRRAGDPAGWLREGHRPDVGRKLEPHRDGHRYRRQHGSTSRRWWNGSGSTLARFARHRVTPMRSVILQPPTFTTTFLRVADKRLWFLEAHIQKPSHD